VRNWRQAYAAQMVATGVQHAPAAAGATVCYRSLQWSQNQRPSLLSSDSVPVSELPTELPELPDDQYSLPELVGAMFDSTILAGDAILVVADTWCRHALDGLHRAGRVVRPLRDAAERARAAARAAAALEEGDADERLTTSFLSSTDSDAGSGCRLR
jgi:hypothetical protein